MEFPDEDFRKRVASDARLRAIVNTLLGELVALEVTSHDVIRCAVLACQLYAERYRAPMVVRLEQDT